MKKSLTAILLGLAVVAAASSPAATQAQTITTAARPTAPANATYEVWYKVKKTGQIYHYSTTQNYASATRSRNYLNEDPALFAWIKTK